MGLGKTYSTKYLLDSNNSSGVAGQVLSTTSTGIDWVDANSLPGTGLWVTSGNNIYNSNSGNVGIGTTSPDSKLSIYSAFSDTAGTGIIELGTGSTKYWNFRLASSAAADLVIDRTYSGTSSEAFRITRATGNATFAGNVSIVDDKYFAAGTGGDLIIRHLSSDNSSYIQSYTGDFYFDNRATTKSMFFRVSNSSAGDTTALTIKSNGNVGIGTTNPTNLSANTSSLTVSSARADLSGAIFFKANDVNKAQIYWDSSGQVNSTISGSMKWRTAGSERMRISSTGNVGIGTASPGYKLEVNGKIATPTGAIIIEGQEIYANSEYSGNDGGVRINRFGYLGGQTKFRDTVIYNGRGSQILTVDGSAGNVGIGTTSPANKLHVSSDTTYDGIQISGASIPTLAIVDTTNNAKLTAYTRDSDATIGTETNHHLTINTNNIERVRITQAGRVGIGTTSPTQKLDVRGGAGVGTLTHAIFTGTTSRGLELRTRSDVSGGQYSGCAEINSADSEGTGGDLALSSNGNIRMFIEGGGNVGIGTTSPTAKLDVYSTTADQHGILRVRQAVASNDPTVLIEHTVAGGNADEDTGLVIKSVGSGAGNQNPLAVYKENGTDRAFKVDGSGNGTFAGDITLDDDLNFSTNGFADISNTGTGAMRFKPSSQTLALTLTGANATFAGNATVNGGQLYVQNAVNPLVYLNDTNAGAGIFQQEGNTTRIGSDSNTQVVLVQNNSTAVTISTSKNVGIGTTSPSKKLHVVESGTNNTAIFENSGQTYSYTAIKVAEAVNNKAGLSFAVGDALASTDIQAEIAGVVVNDGGTLKGDMTFKTNQGDDLEERMRILANGNVGIGTTSPTGYRLVVENTSEDLLKLHNSTDGLDALIAFTNPGGTLGRIQGIDNGGLAFDVGDNAGGIVSNAMFIKNNGKVGIGTTSPNAKLEVTGDIEDNWAGRFENTNSGGYGILAKIAGTSANERIFEARVGSSTKMLISGDGKATFAGDVQIDGTLSGAGAFVPVGGGTFTGNVLINKAANPTSLQIGSNLADDPFLVFQSDGNTMSMGIDRSDSNKFVISDNATLGTNNRLTIDTSGNSTFAGSVGVGMAPDSAVALTVSGQIGPTNGTAAAPTHTFYSDDDTGMYRSAANALSFSTSGTLALTLDSSQNATFAGSVTVGGDIKINNTTPYLYNNDDEILVGSDAGGYYFGLVGSDNSTKPLFIGDHNSYIRFDTDGDEAMRLDSSQNATFAGTIGIGTTPTTNAIEIDGADGTSYVFFKSAAATTGARVGLNSDDLIIENKQAAGDIIFDTAATERIRITSSGNVGIGTTSPNYKLEVNGTLGVNRTNGIIFAGSGGAGMGNKITADTSNDLIFSMSLPSAPYTVSEKMRIANNGATTFTSTVTATNFILSSDERLKENVEKVCDNRVKADWKTFELKTDKGQKRYGVIAQELEKTNPEFVREDSQGFKSVAYIDLLIAKIAELEARLEKLEK